jgi:hypothetical protein
VRSGQQFEPGAGSTPRLGQVEYRLARDGVVRSYRRGRLSRLDVCDAQPELLRVARNLGSETLIDCPICVEAKLVHVSFAFGPNLPACGRALESPAELAKIARRGSDVVCYVVEVCKECSWNHLVRMFAAGPAKRSV